MSADSPLRVLIVEDHPADAELELRELRRGGINMVAQHVDSLPDLESSLDAFRPDVILCDYNLPGFDGVDALRVVRKRSRTLPFIFVSGSIGEERAAEALREGANDYVMKDRLNRLPVAVEQAVAARRAAEALHLSEERFRLVAQATNDGIWDWNVGSDETWLSERFRELFGLGPERETVSYEWWLENIHPDDQASVSRVLEDAMGGRGDFIVEYRFRRSDGTWAEVYDRGKVIDDGDGRPVRMIGALQDVGPRKAAERALRESERRFRSVAQTAKDAILIIDASGHITFSNPAVESIFGLPPAELNGRPVSALLGNPSPWSNERVMEFLSEEIRRTAPASIPVPLLTEDGVRIYADVSVSGWFLDGARYFTAVVRDVSDRHRRQERDRLITKYSRELLARPLEEMGAAARETLQDVAAEIDSECVCIAFLSADGTRVGDVIEWLEEAVGSACPAAGEPAESLQALLPSNGAKLAVPLLRNGALFGVIATRLRQPPGELREELEAFLRVIGELTATSFARKRAVEDLKRSRAVLAEAQSIARIGTYEKDLGDGQVRWSAELLGLYGIDPGAAISAEDIMAMIHPEDQARFRAACDEAAAGKAARTIEYRFLAPGGRQMTFELTISPVPDASGKTVQLFGIVQDITRRVSLERQVEQGNRIAALGRLAATIAHEFNNVLMGIQPFAELLRRKIGSADARSESAVDSILNSVKRGRNITHEILRFTQPSTPVVEPIEVNDWIRSLTEELQGVVGSRIEVDVRLAPGPLAIRGDRSQLTQVVSNLVYNARDAMPRGGRIILAIERLEESVQLSVTDEGEGIPAHVLPQIFEPLFTTKKSGTGLGLAVAYQIVQRYSGTITVESTPGAGTTFRLVIPLA